MLTNGGTSTTGLFLHILLPQYHSLDTCLNILWAIIIVTLENLCLQYMKKISNSNDHSHSSDFELKNSYTTSLGVS